MTNVPERPDVDMNDVAYVFASRRRLEVVLGLNERYMTQKHLSRMLSLDYSNTGRSLRQLLKWELAVCQSPGVRKGALYSLSERGIEVVEYIEYLVSAFNDGIMLEPHECEALVTLARYRMRVTSSNFYALNWKIDLNEEEQVADGSHAYLQHDR